MATAPLLDVAEDRTALVVAVNKSPGIVLLDTEKFDVFYEKLKAEAPTDADVSTKKGSDVLRSYASDVRSKKAAIDKARLQLTKEWRDMTSQANAAGKMIEERLEGLAAEVRAPLTAWEKAEEDRVNFCREVIDSFKRAGVVTILDTAEMVRNRGQELWAQTIEPDTFGDMLGEAQSAKDASVATLKEALARLTREEEERAELEKLRADKEARDLADAERLAKEEREAAEAEEARIAEQRKAADEKAEADRIAQVARDAEQRVRDEAARELEAAEAKRQYARSIIQHIKEVGLGMIGGQTYPYGILLHELTDKIVINDDLGDLKDEVAAIRDATLASVQAAMERSQLRAQQEEQRAEEAERIAEQAKRDADTKHRTAVMKAAKEAIMTCGADEETAKKIVLAIKAGEIPNVTLRF